MSNYDSAGVYIRERDLSAVIVTEAATVAAIVGVFSRGRSDKPQLFTDSKSFRDAMGDPDANVSMAGYCVINFFEKGGRQIQVKRAVHSDAMYGACGIKTALGLTPLTILDPSDIDWTAAAGGSGTAVALIHDVGQSSQSAGKSFRLQSRNPVAPVAAAVTATGGTLTATTLFNYLVVARNGGNTLSSGHTVASGSVSTDTSKKSITLSWNWDNVASSYDVYQAVAAGPYQFLAAVGMKSQVDGVFTFVDDGTAVPNAARQVALPLAAVTEAAFKIVFYDTTVFANSPIETFDVTWGDAIDGDGVQTNIEERVNSRSKKFRIAINPLAQLPVVYNTVRTALGTGTAGTAPTASDVASNWDFFADPEDITARVFINGGYSNPIVQKKMDQVAHTRGDAVAILDAPPDVQTDDMYALVDYRNLDLNLNSDRAALYSPDILYADLINGKTLYIPPSGFVAGVFAFTDFTRNPSVQPAGMQRGQLPNALGTRVRYKQTARDILAPAQINPIVNFPGEGIVPWEALTMQAMHSGFSFVGIRRIFDVIEVAIRKFLKPQIHDPNDEYTRRAIKAALVEYLNFWIDQRAIKRFDVDLSDSINPGYLSTLGQLNAHILIEPIFPIRFIECTIGMTKAGANFEYLISGNALG